MRCFRVPPNDAADAPAPFQPGSQARHGAAAPLLHTALALALSAVGASGVLGITGVLGAVVALAPVGLARAQAPAPAGTASPTRPAGAASAAEAASRSASAAPGPLMAQLTALLARIEKDRSNSEVASAAGTSALDLDEAKPVWAGERRAAVSTLFAVARAPGASAATTQALVALQNGNVNALLGWLADQETAALTRSRKETGAAAAAARMAALQAARQQGALALGIDNQAALAAFRRTVELDSDDYWAHITIGDLLAQVNDPGGAASSYQTAAAVLRTTVLGEPANAKPAPTDQPLSHAPERRVLLVCELRQGEALASADDREAALRAFQRALVPAEALLAAEPSVAERLFEVATVSDRVAELLGALNQWPGALAAHQRSLALAEALAASDKDNEAQWEFYIKDKIEHVADLQLALGQPDVALTNYKRGLDLGEKLITINVTNDAWLSSTLGLIAKVGSSASLAQTGEERRQLLLRGLELLGRVRSGEVWDNSEEWGDRLRQALDELPNPSDEIEQSQ